MTYQDYIETSWNQDRGGLQLWAQSSDGIWWILATKGQAWHFGPTGMIEKVSGAFRWAMHSPPGEVASHIPGEVTAEMKEHPGEVTRRISKEEAAMILFAATPPSLS